ncbi:carboxypeptidase-like regulatory domain-containing protein [Neolewinella aurantiaca]|uniref:Carboxypeptidase-like regulatory domain-containing protein n=1 Tax=Neolewinella aurantiaca TaxID=2602767 RepID=A0A5C7FHJ7_9BACT|nr:DUF5686 and carboxypeptidase regulatory-like domain-containing protein [Neolewinella aurantiaca]TXF90587.1 carboxypeptidase-like regulatory domain-containing protein [Neolewinella aurantiaca]
MRTLFSLLLVTFLCTCVSAQTVSGRITDAETGDPLPFASIYVPSTKSGAASNGDGYFQVDLGGGNKVVFSYLGYQTQVKTISGGNADVQLVSESLDLETVEIISGGEDKSYAVIRRAIAKADYHRNQLDAYSAEVYIKGTGKVNKIPGLIKMLAGKEDREEIEEVTKRPFTSETTSKVEYTRPNNYKQQVLSKLEVGDSDFDANQYFFTSFYDPLVAGELVSPLHPRAFGYYKFEHEGVFVDQDELINKIKVIPRSRGEDVFEGYIYIVNGDWAIHSLELTTYKLGFQIDITQRQAEIEDHIWMPVTTTLDAEGQFFGVAFEYHYLSTVSGYALTLNPDLGGYVEVIDEKSQPEVASQTKKAKKLSELEQRLNEGGEIKRKDLFKLMRSYEKEEREKSPEPEVVKTYSFVQDSTVEIITDTASWAKIRPVPLTEQEVLAYAIADSLERRDSIVSVTSNGAGDSGVEVSIKSNQTRKKPHLRTTFFPDPFFNPVEGYALGGRIGFRNTRKQWNVGFNPRYGIGWKRLSWQADLRLGRSGKDNEPQFKLSGGRFLRQFDDGPAIEPWISTYTNLFNGTNYIRLYERAYGQFDYRKNYGDAWRAEATIAYEDRRAVLNSSNNNWFGLDDEEVYAENLPFNAERGPVGVVAPAAIVKLGVAWRPGLEYVMNGKRKELIENSAPTITASIRTGIPNIGESASDFTALEASYQRRFANGKKGNVDLLVRGGTFLNRETVGFPDYKHFATSELVLTALDPIGSYRLLPYYLESTNKEYLEVYGHYQFRKFLLTQIWQLHLAGLKEDLFVNYLYTPTSDNYTELGYSIDNIFRVLRVEFVTGFRDFKYDDFGVRISIASTFGRF